MLCRCVFKISPNFQRNFIKSVRFASHYHSSARLTKEHMSSFYFQGSLIRIASKTDAYELVHFLKFPEQQMLLEALEEHEKAEKLLKLPKKVPEEVQVESGPAIISREQMRAIFLQNFVPFIGFGLLDNLVMIAAGEYIDSTLGVVLGLSTTVFPSNFAASICIHLQGRRIEVCFNKL